MRKLASPSATEKGQSMIELAVSITVLLILLAGLADLGRAIFYYLSMRDAAQEGLVYGSVYPWHCAQIVEMVRKNVDDSNNDVIIRMNGMSCSDANATEASSRANACSGKEIQVTVVEPDFEITMPLLGGFINTQSLRLQASVKGSILRPACQ